ncbi:MAG: hypothetical protein IT317_17190 [Anaerolineales bacterium]|nr:hypothetical protein [Anaerolineales bacterium]
MSASRLARLARRLAGRPWWHKGRWGRPRRLVGAGVRLSASASAGWHGPQAAQGPRAPGEVQAPRWALDEEAVVTLKLAAKALPHVATVTNTMTNTLPELKGLDG